MDPVQKDLENHETGAGLRESGPGSRFRFPAWLPVALSVTAIAAGAGCAVFATRPVQEMSDTAAAIRAAREVQAETMAPELFRQAGEWFQRAKNEYKLKNFDAAKEAAEKSRRFAELAEFAALKGGTAVRSDVNIPDPIADTNPLPGQGTVATPSPEPSPSPYVYPTPEGTPYSEYERRRAEDEAAARKKAEKQASPTPSPSPAGVPVPVLTAPGGTTFQSAP